MCYVILVQPPIFPLLLCSTRLSCYHQLSRRRRFGLGHWAAGGNTRETGQRHRRKLYKNRSLCRIGCDLDWTRGKSRDWVGRDGGGLRLGLGLLNRVFACESKV